jgi:hypothetical protein
LKSIGLNAGTVSKAICFNGSSIPFQAMMMMDAGAVFKIIITQMKLNSSLHPGFSLSSLNNTQPLVFPAQHDHEGTEY